MKFKFNKKFMIIVFLAIFITVITTSFGRFIYNEIKNNFFNTKNFYFESDKLRENQALYQINNYNGVDAYDFAININSFKNNKLKATTDIEYKIEYTCSTNVYCDVDKTVGIIYASNNTDNVIATIIPKVTLNNKDIVWIEVTAKAIKPYAKTLSARFVLTVGYYGLSHEISDSTHKPYLELKVTNTLDYYNIVEAFDSYQVGDKIDLKTYLDLPTSKQEKCASAFVTLSFNPNVILLDMTSKVYYDAVDIKRVTINGFLYVNEIKFKIDAISSQIVRFYKINVINDYTFPIVNPTSIVGVSYS